MVTHFGFGLTVFNKEANFFHNFQSTLTLSIYFLWYWNQARICFPEPTNT